MCVAQIRSCQAGLFAFGCYMHSRFMYYCLARSQIADVHGCVVCLHDKQPVPAKKGRSQTFL